MAARFGIRWLLAVIAVYGVLFAANKSLGLAGMIVVVVVGTAISCVIILARRADVAAIFCGTICATLGAVPGLGCLSPMILSSRYGYDHGFGETARSDIVGGIIGAVCGAFVASMISHKRPPTDSVE